MWRRSKTWHMLNRELSFVGQGKGPKKSFIYKGVQSSSRWLRAPSPVAFPPKSPPLLPQIQFQRDMFAFTVLSALLLAGQACASSVVGRSTIAGLLQARQSGGFNPSDIPASCQNVCASTVAVLDSATCTTVSCLCTSQVNSGFQGCLGCLLGLEGNDPSDVADAQAALASYEDSCKAAGVPLASLSVGGAAPASTQAATTAAPIGASTASAASPSVFFSSTPGAGGGGLSTTPSSQTTRSIITAGGSSSGSPTGAGALNPSASGTVGNGAGSVSFNGGSAVVLSGILAGVVMVLGL